MRIIDMRPPRIAIVLTLIAAVLHWTLNIWDKVRWSLFEGGMIVGVIGFTLMMWSWCLFRIEDAPICLPSRSTILITDGPYLFSRNPMYLGMILIMLGLALCVGTLPFYISSIVYFAIINFLFVPYEEKKLANSFGEEYLRYMSEVRRWV